MGIEPDPERLWQAIRDFPLPKRHQGGTVFSRVGKPVAHLTEGPYREKFSIYLAVQTESALPIGD